MIDTSVRDQASSEALLIRTWTEPAMPHARRARLLTVNAENEPDTWSTVVGDAAIAQEVLRWLRSKHDSATGTGPPAPVQRTGPDQPPPLVDADWAQAHLKNPGVHFVEVTNGEVGVAARPAGHLPGAASIDWPTDLHHPTRRTLVDSAGFATLMDSRGIPTHSHVVLCSHQSISWAAAAYWHFIYHGHQRVSLLDGGCNGWLAQGRPMTDAAATPRPVTCGYFTAARREEILLHRDQLLAGLVGAPPGTMLVDCRSAGEFAGQPARPYDVPTDRHRVPGHIPGAINLPVDDLVDPRTHRLLALPALHALCDRLGLNRQDQIIVYCGVGERSALVWFVLHELLGWPDVRYYFGAWAEYGSLIDVPVEPGP